MAAKDQRFTYLSADSRLSPRARSDLLALTHVQHVQLSAGASQEVLWSDCLSVGG